MKVYIPNTSKQSIGGGWTFLRNFKKGFEKEYIMKHPAVGISTTFYKDSDVLKDELVNNWKDCDIVLITGATMTNRDEMIDAKRAGKKIVFRVDNIPRDSRNRGTAFSRMIDFAKMSDFIIFQSEWAKDYAGWWFVENGVDITNRSDIVYNGVDTEFFFKYKDDLSMVVPKAHSVRKKNRYVYVQFNRDENKRMTEAFYLFHQAYRKDKDVELHLVGQYSPELIQNNFDFFAGEQVSYKGIIESPKYMGNLFRECEYLLFPAFADASSNQLTEALACGCEPIGINPIGGSIEIVNRWEKGIIPSIQDMGKSYIEIFEKVLYSK